MLVSKPAPPIAVIGMSARFPGANDIERYWANLVDGVESVCRRAGAAEQDPGSTDGRFVPAVARVSDVDLFDAEYFRIPPAEAAIMDPQHRVLLEVAVAAMEDAGYHGAHDEVVGVFVGCGENYYLNDFVLPNERRTQPAADRAELAVNDIDTRIHAANDKDFLASRIAFKLGLTGPSVTMQTTCATSLSAVALACTALAAGDCDLALAGGISLVMPDVDGYTYTSGGIFSSDGVCRSFDADASGTIPGSGAGLVVLRRAADARDSRDRCRAVIRGWAINNDGGSRAGFTAPSAAGQQAVIQAALARAGIAPDEVGYVETHATATPIGDAVEFEALRRVFAVGTPDSSCVLGAVKPNIGHADAAAGIAGLIKAVLAVEHGLIPPTLHFRSANPQLNLAGSPFQISAEALPWPSGKARIAGVSAFGLGGNNAHVVVQQADPPLAAISVRPRQLIALSARTEAELCQLRAALADWLRNRQPLSPAELADVAFTLAVGRPRFEYRWAACVPDSAMLLEELAASTTSARPALRWSLNIHGSYPEHAAMGRRQLRAEPILRNALAELTGDAEVDRWSPVQLAALAALSAMRSLRQLGMEFGRIDAPAWFQPVLHWLTSGADPATLAHALDACVPDDDAGVARPGTGCLLVGPDFDLAASVARAWAQSARIDWCRYYAMESRGRVPLPTYPFNRRSYWLPRRRHPVPEAEDSNGSPPAWGLNTTEVAQTVETVWQRVLGLDAVDRDAHFIDDLAGDSMYAVEIGAQLREVFQVELPLDLPFVAPTVASAAQFIEGALSTAGRPASSE